MQATSAGLFIEFENTEVDALSSNLRMSWPWAYMCSDLCDKWQSGNRLTCVTMCDKVEAGTTLYNLYSALVVSGSVVGLFMRVVVQLQCD